MQRTAIFALWIVALATIACSTDRQSGQTIYGGNCSLNGQSVSCLVFQDHITTESIADFTGLDCRAMANIANLRTEGWAQAEAAGKASNDERLHAWRGIDGAVKQLGCGKATPTPPARQTSMSDCSLNGRAVSCKVFQDHIMAESVADFTGLDCDDMAKVAGLRIEGWALAEATGKISTNEGYHAGRAISSAVNQLRCGNNSTWQAYLKSLP